MLHQDPLMLNIHVDHWRNLQALLLDSAKSRRRIVVIHEDGEVHKLVHSSREPIYGTVERVDDPHAVAERLYRDNAQNVDFVAVFERRAFDEYFGRFQATWRADEDLDLFVQRTYALLDEYRDGIVTFPEPARHTLGLQWRIGNSHGEITDAVAAFVPPDSSVVFGIFEEDALWASLVVRFDSDLRAHVVTTVDAFEVSAEGGRSAVVDEVIEWVNRRYGPCSLAIFTSLDNARDIVATNEKLALLRNLFERGELLVGAAPTTFPLQPMADRFA